MDHPRGLVVERAPGGLARQEIRPVDTRTRVRLARRALVRGGQDDHRELRAFRRLDGGVERVVLDVGDADDALDRPVERDRLDDHAGRFVDERDPAAGRDDEGVAPEWVGELGHAGQAWPGELGDPDGVEDHDVAPVGLGAVRAGGQHGCEPAAVPGQEQLRDRGVELGPRIRGEAGHRGLAPIVVEQGRVDREDLAGPRAHVQEGVVVVECDRDGTGQRDRRGELPRSQVVPADLAARREPEPVALDRRRVLAVVPARLDGRVDDRDAELARRADPVLAEGHDPDGHRVLGHVRVRPLVDVVRDVVAPVLEELGGGPGVVDLVEMHLVRLGQPPHAHGQERDRKEREHPDVQPVEPATALAGKLRAPVGSDGSIAEACLEPGPGPRTSLVRLHPARHDVEVGVHVRRGAGTGANARAHARRSPGAHEPILGRPWAARERRRPAREWLGVLGR